MRLIDADALRAAMYHEAFETDSDMQRWDRGCWIRYKMFENAIEAAPTIEAESVKSGCWIEDNDEKRPALFQRGWLCSACGSRQSYGRSEYCPHCGAKMEVPE